MQKFKLFIIALISAICFDLSWLCLFGIRFYATYIGSISRKVDGIIMPNFYVLVWVYVLLAIGMVYFVLPQANGKLSRAIVCGGLYGLIALGIYTLLNLACLAYWPPVVALMDILGGIYVGSMSCLVTVYSANYLNRK